MKEKCAEILREWLKNPYWREYFEKAPSVKCRDVIMLEFLYSEEETEEVEEARAYAKEHGIRFSGRNAYPQFVKCEPNRLPWKMKKQEAEEPPHL